MGRAESFSHLPDHTLQNLLDTSATIQHIQQKFLPGDQDIVCQLTDTKETGSRLLIYDLEQWQNRVFQEYEIQDIPTYGDLESERHARLQEQAIIFQKINPPAEELKRVYDANERVKKKRKQETETRTREVQKEINIFSEELETANPNRADAYRLTQMLRERKASAHANRTLDRDTQ
jgi:hypothetical protein